MTQRDRQKKGRTATARASSRVVRSEAGAKKTPADVIAQLESELSELRAQLTAAEDRIKQLESQRAEVLNRIDWVIDSIHNVLEREN